MERGEEEEEVAKRTEEVGERTETGADKDGSFDGESNGDGVVFEFGGNGESEAGDSEAGVEKSRGGGLLGARIGKKQDDGFMGDGEGEEEKGERPAIIGPEQRVENGDIGERVGEDEKSIPGAKRQTQ